MSRFNPRAIAIAMLLSLSLDVIGGVLLVAGFSTGLRSDMSAEEVNAVVESVMQGTGFMLASLVYGMGTTVFAGYVAARIAGTYPYFNALAVGVIGIVLSLVLGNDAPLWYSALAYLLSVPAALVGGHVARQRLRADR